MATKRSTQLAVIGSSVFIIGAALVYLGLRTDGTPSAPRPTVTPTASVEPSRIITVQRPNAAPVDVAIPKDKQAVAVSLPRVAAVAGYVKPGDLINLYVTVKTGSSDIACTPGTRGCARKAGDLAIPYAKLLLSNVRVLDVQPAVGEGDIVYLLALDSIEAERAIFYAKFESLWATLVPPGQKPSTAAGTDHARGLKK